MERFADDANLVGTLREIYWQHGVLTSQVKAGKEAEGQKFADYFAFAEKVNIIFRIVLWRYYVVVMKGFYKLI